MLIDFKRTNPDWSKDLRDDETSGAFITSDGPIPDLTRMKIPPADAGDYFPPPLLRVRPLA